MLAPVRGKPGKPGLEKIFKHQVLRRSRYRFYYGGATSPILSPTYTLRVTILGEQGTSQYCQAHPSSSYDFSFGVEPRFHPQGFPQATA